MSINSIQTTNKNTCPHGLPQGTCPICNGSMAGGGRRMASDNVKKNNNEWSWMKCYIEGRMMRGQEARHEASMKFTTNPIENQSAFAKNILSFTSNVKTLLNNVYEALPPSIQNVFLKITNNVLTPLNNLLSKIPNIVNEIKNMAQEIKVLVMSVSEKLAAILGELKNFVNKKIFDKLKRITKKILKFFIWEKDEEKTEIDEEMEVFKARELKKIQNAIFHLRREEEDK